jgi:hypothetical protein
MKRQGANNDISGGSWCGFFWISLDFRGFFLYLCAALLCLGSVLALLKGMGGKDLWIDFNRAGSNLLY